MTETCTQLNRRELPAAMLFGALLLVPSIVWISLDHRVWDWDPAEYGYLSIDLWRMLWTRPRLWPWFFFHGVGPKAPTLIWIAHFLLPLRHALGSTQAVFHFVILVFQWGSLVLLWQCMRTLSGRKWAAYAAVLFLAGMPLFAGLNQDFLTEPLQLFAVLLIWCAALHGASWSAATLTAWLLWGAAFVLGAKASTPMYAVVPGLYLLFLWLKSLRAASWGLTWRNGLGMATGLAHLIVIGTWYVVNLRLMFQKVVDASVGEAAYSFGYHDTFFNKLLYWLSAMRRSMTLGSTTPILMLCGLVLLAGAIQARRRKTGPSPASPRLRLAVYLALAQLVLSFSILSVNISTPVRYVYPMIPAVLFLLPPWMRLADGLWVRRLALAGLAMWFGGSHLFLLGLRPDSEVARARYWAGPERDSAKLEQVQYLISQLNVPEYDGVYHLCGVNSSWLSGSTLNYYAALDSLQSGVRTRFGRLGHDITEVEPAWERVHGKLGSYIAASDGHMLGRTDRFGEIAREILSRIQADPRFEKEPHSALRDIVVYRNVAFGVTAEDVSP